MKLQDPQLFEESMVESEKDKDTERSKRYFNRINQIEIAASSENNKHDSAVSDSENIDISRVFMYEFIGESIQ